MALPPWQVHFARHFLLKYLTSAWESAEGNYILLPGTFYENIKSAWQSAEENYTLLPGQVKKCGSITLNFDVARPSAKVRKYYFELR